MYEDMTLPNPAVPKSGKRVRDLEPPANPGKRAKTGGHGDTESTHSRIQFLECSILESRKNYNCILELLDHLRKYGRGKINVVTAVALCRIFCKLLALDEMGTSGKKIGDEATIAKWLEERLDFFESVLLQTLGSEYELEQHAALTILMRLLKGKYKHYTKAAHFSWEKGLFASIIRVLATTLGAAEARRDFIDNYVSQYADIRYYTLKSLSDTSMPGDDRTHLTCTLSMLCAIDPFSERDETPLAFFLPPSVKMNRILQSAVAQKKVAQKVWMLVMRTKLSKGERKQILEQIPHRIAPCFLKTELLMDFLTDSFNIGGSVSLLALSGLFHLIQTKNLDYPQFYPKVYSLLQADILHSKHRSPFFRLLDEFLASSHLPAALVASFIKRLSRLSLHAPPSAIVVVVPWTYNLLKTHPTCTFMLHREAGHASKGSGDPFRMEETDPMETKAIDSSLWELHTLQSHYHPNVAAIAKIMSEQFTRQGYNIEDFLDHSYATMVEMELSKSLKKAPEVEYEIPKRILTKGDTGDLGGDSLLLQIWNFDS